MLALIWKWKWIFCKFGYKMNIKFNIYKAFGRSHFCVHPPKLQNTVTLEGCDKKKRTTFKIVHWWKKIHLAEYTFQNVTLAFSKKYATVPSCFWKKVQSSLVIPEAGLGGCLPRGGWCSRLGDIASTEKVSTFPIRIIWCSCISVKCWKHSELIAESESDLFILVTVWSRSIVTFISGKTIWQWTWSGNWRHVIFRKWATIHFRRI